MEELYTQSDIKEINERINNRVCPHCGNTIQVEVSYQGDVFRYNANHSCCDQSQEIGKFLKEEIENQNRLKIDRIFGL